MSTGSGPADLRARFEILAATSLPLPGGGQTPLRHARLMAVGREDLSLARLTEAHWDAVAILSEAGRLPSPGATYGVWASERAGQAVRLETRSGTMTIAGAKMFCSGAGLLDRALVTVSEPEQLLVEIDLRSHASTIAADASVWKTPVFAETQTAAVSFDATPVSQVVGGPGWYLSRPGFWHGACGPAACWAGGATGLVDFARRQTRRDAHTLAHLGAMEAAVWALSAYLEKAGREIDEDPLGGHGAMARALTVRHLVEQAASGIAGRLTRAYGPHPLVADEGVSRRFHELNIYLRQSHAERDLEALARSLLEQRDGAI